MRKSKDITMIPGRDDNVKKEIALKVQHFLSEEVNIDEKFVSVSIEDVAMEGWSKHMEGLSDTVMFVKPGV